MMTLNDKPLLKSSKEHEVVKHLHLESSDLQVVPDTVFYAAEILTELYLDFNDISQLPQAFSKLCSLKKLSLNGNMLTELPSVLGELHSLEEIFVCENEVESINPGFCCLKSLKILNVVGNKLTFLPDNFSQLESLENFSCDENNLKVLRNSFCELSKLQTIEIGYNCLSSLPSKISQLKSLRCLDVRHNLLTELPESLGLLENLEQLDLSSNKLHKLPSTCKSSHKLRVVSVDKNSLEILPAWISDLPSCTEISLKENQLTNRPLLESFGHINKKLERLHLSGNFIDKLPESMGELENLKWFHIGSHIFELERSNFQNGNWIRCLPESFGMMKKLVHLRLDENQIQYLPDGFGGLENLEYLDLGQNQLHDLPESFGKLKKLEYCQLSKNHIEILPSSIGNLSSLKCLRLDSNKLAELPESFSLLTTLECLDLFSNCLTEIPDFLKHFSQLKVLDLHENNFGVPLDEIPSIITECIYLEKDKNQSKNWRGKISIGSASFKSFVSKEVTNPDLVPMSWKNTSAQTLTEAMGKSASLWQTHGNIHGKRVAFHKDNSDVDSRSMTSPTPSSSKSLESELSHDDSQKEGEWDFLENKSSENWDDEVDTENDWAQEANKLEQLSTENWDDEIEPANQFDDDIYDQSDFPPAVNTSSKMTDLTGYIYVPAFEHACEYWPKFKQMRSYNFPIVEEQFDYLESDKSLCDCWSNKRILECGNMALDYFQCEHSQV